MPDLAVSNAGSGSTADFVSVAQQAGTSRAFQSIAQSVAISVQDAVDNLRNVETISTTATGVAMAQLLTTKDPAYGMIIDQAQSLMANAIKNYSAVGKAAADIISEFKNA